MPSIDENFEFWNNYDWRDGGDEWSEVWGTTENLWLGSLLPRIRSYIPVPRILEIAPGFGRITHFLKDYCDELVIVDLTQRCVDACRKRFAEETKIVYQINDGKSLPEVRSHSIDFAFSFDSLVHVEIDVIVAYLTEFARVLSADGIAFIHHSNIAVYRDSSTNGLTIANDHWRGSSVSAEIVRTVSAEVGLSCIRQEVVNWGVPHLTDCFSTFTPAGSRHEAQFDLIENPNFMDEAIELGQRGLPTEGD